MKVWLLWLGLMLCVPGAWAQEGRKMVLGADANWRPMEYLDENNKIVGFSIDYITLALEKVGYQAVFRDVAWKGLFAGLNGRQINAICSSVTVTEARRQIMDFSEPYFIVHQAVVTPSESPVASLADLSGRTVGAQRGTTGAAVARRGAGATLKTFDTIEEAFEDLRTGRLDAAVCDSPVAAAVVADGDGRLKVAVIIDDAEPERYAIAVRRGDTATLQLINRGLQGVRAQGLDKELLAKWFPSSTAASSAPEAENTSIAVDEGINNGHPEPTNEAAPAATEAEPVGNHSDTPWLDQEEAVISPENGPEAATDSTPEGTLFESLESGPPAVIVGPLQSSESQQLD